MNLETKKLYYSILEGLFSKKGKEVTEIDLTGINNAICDYFIICHGDSNTQVNSIAESIEEKVKKNLNTNAFHREGFENSQWILLDYAEIIVHIFQKEYRDYYNLEDLWADGESKKIEDVGDFTILINSNE